MNLYESSKCHSRKVICVCARDLYPLVTKRESRLDERRERKPVNRARLWQIEEERTERQRHGAVRRTRRVDAEEKRLAFSRNIARDNRSFATTRRSRSITQRVHTTRRALAATEERGTSSGASMAVGAQLFSRHCLHIW